MVTYTEIILIFRHEINPFATYNKLLNDLRFVHTKHINMHVVPMQIFLHDFRVIPIRIPPNYSNNIEEVFLVLDSKVWILNRWLHRISHKKPFKKGLRESHKYIYFKRLFVFLSLRCSSWLLVYVFYISQLHVYKSVRVSRLACRHRFSADKPRIIHRKYWWDISLLNKEMFKLKRNNRTE